MKKKILPFILFVVVLALPHAVFAGELVLIKGKGIPVCEAHYKNLKDLNCLDHMVCERNKYYPEQNGITRPKWKELDLKENKELVKRIHKFFSKGDQFGASKLIDDEKEFEKYFNDSILKYNSLNKATVDIGNNGKPEIVMLYRKSRCDVDRNTAYNIPYSRPLFVLDKDKNFIDIKKTEPLLQNPFPRDIKAKAVNSIYQLYDILIYKNTSYFDKWNVRDWTLTVYYQSKDEVKEVCGYQYQQ